MSNSDKRAENQVYRPGMATDELVDSLCFMFSDIACKRKLTEGEGIRSKYIDKYGVDILFSKSTPGLFRLRFVTEDDIEIAHTNDLTLIAKDPEIIHAMKHDTMMGIMKVRSERAPLEINTQQDEIPVADANEKEGKTTVIEAAERFTH